MHNHAVTACKAARVQLISALCFIQDANNLLRKATDSPEQGVVNKGVDSDVRADVLDAEIAVRRARRAITEALVDSLHTSTPGS